MNIGIRTEGGIGDHLLAIRFVKAIEEKYPNSNIKIYSDTENNPISANFLKTIYPLMCNNIEVVKERKSKQFRIKSQFGEEVYNAAIENQTDEYLEKYRSHDKFYDLCIDKLDWLNHDYDWMRYYYSFPKPEVNINHHNIDLPEKFVACHLYARPNSPYNLDKWYVESLVKKIGQNIPVVIITQEDHLDFYDGLKGLENVYIKTVSLLEALHIVNKSVLTLNIDSGIRYFGYLCSKPVYVFSKYCQQYGQVVHSHLIRWLLFDKAVLPMHLDVDKVLSIVKNTIQNRAYWLFPYIADNIEQAIVKRDYVVL